MKLLKPARYGCAAQLDKSSVVLHRIDKSVSMLDRYLAKGYFVYGKQNPSTDEW